MIIGVLALQGAFIEHKHILDKINIENILIKKIDDVKICDGIIIPGGESTAMGIIEENVFQEISNHIKKGKAVWGTCAGLILLANTIIGQKKDGQKNIGGLDVCVQRNYFGSQKQSFIKILDYPAEFCKVGKFETIFIRAPVILAVGKNVDTLLKLDNNIIAVRQNNILGTSFHPELSNNYSWHEYFIELVKVLRT